MEDKSAKVRDCAACVRGVACRAASRGTVPISGQQKWDCPFLAAALEIPGEAARFSFEQRHGDNLANSLKKPAQAVVHGENRLVPGSREAIQCTGDDQVDLPLGNYDRSQPFSVSLWLRRRTSRTGPSSFIAPPRGPTPAAGDMNCSSRTVALSGR